MTRTWLNLLIIIFLVPLLGFVALLSYLFFTEYKPARETLLFEAKNTATTFDSTKTYNALIWNIGFAGLGQNMDFFYDGGTMVRDSNENTLANFAAIKANLVEFSKTADFMLLQEVDKHSKRTYDLNEVQLLTDTFTDFNLQFGKNYDVKFVPAPIFSPLGHVKSGVLTLSKYVPDAAIRYSYPAKFAFPKNLAMLKRCFVVNRYKLDNGKEFILVNTHNSAYDDGSMRIKEMNYLKDFLNKEYQQGNYILVGGDWNQTPTKYQPKFNKHAFAEHDFVRVNANFLPEWNWVYDENAPSLRNTDQPYVLGKTLTKTTDFYLASPNVEAIEVETIDFKFAHSDHNPVRLKFKFKN